MMNHIVKQAACAAISTIFAGVSLAAVGLEEAKQLGSTLTLFGAEKAANKDGSIPAFTGERITPPSNYDPAEPLRLPNPWNDKPLFSITAQNMSQYADKLSEGQKALFKSQPNYRMDIYPTRRSVQYPKYVLDNSVKNATSCKTLNNGLQVENCYGGVLFPVPKNGNEVMWNHVTRYNTYTWRSVVQQVLVTNQGQPLLQSALDIRNELPLYDPKRNGVAAANSDYYKIRFDYFGPPRRVGEKTIIIDSLDPINVGRRAYQYLQGQRRVKLSPDLSYDTPNPSSGGAATMDENNIFFGAQDRYDMKLVGKKEMFIIYNNYDSYDYKKCPAEVFYRPGFANPDCIRWELHRTWVISAKLKPGLRHIYARREMYFDEDTWAAGSADNYDASGNLYRADFAGFYPMYTGIESNVTTPTYVIDLQKGLWYTTLFSAFPGGGVMLEPPRPAAFFSPEALGGQGIR